MNMKQRLKPHLVFIISAIIIFSVVLWGLIASEQMTSTMTWVMDQMIINFGWFYVISTALFVGYCLYLGFGPFRRMKLGKKEDKPEYSFLTWLGMLFAAGMGVGLVFWGVGEPLSHYASPPPGVESETQEAAEKGLLFGVFHWGIHPWAVYAIVALGLAFAKYRKDLPGLISSSFYPLIGDRINKWPGRVIDIVVIVATTVGIATSLGLSTLQVQSGLSQVFGLSGGAVTQLVIIGTVTIIFLTSAVTGLDKGMKYLSISNLGLAGILLVLAIILGPTVFILEHFSKTLGEYVSSFISLSFNTTPYTNNQWMGDWTMFYWAWVISWSPFVGTFIARVSRGRSLQEFVIGVLFVPTLVTVLWFVTFGGMGLQLEMYTDANIASTVLQTPEIGFFLVLEQLPGGFLFNLAALLLIGIFFITSANSATYVLGVFSSAGDMEPKNRTLIIWGLLISSIAAVLLTSGGIKGLQATATITAFPFTIIMLVLMRAIFKSLKTEGKEKKKVKEEEDW